MARVGAASNLLGPHPPLVTVSRRHECCSERMRGTCGVVGARKPLSPLAPPPRPAHPFPCVVITRRRHTPSLVPEGFV